MCMCVCIRERGPKQLGLAHGQGGPGLEYKGLLLGPFTLDPSSIDPVVPPHMERERSLHAVHIQCVCGQ